MNEQIRKLITTAKIPLECTRHYLENNDYMHTATYAQTIQSLQLLEELKQLLIEDKPLDKTINSNYKHQELFKD